jgi:putative PIN family toxin of toxin-antitoxin system
MKCKHHKPLVLFNASVIIAGIYNPSGGSGKILNWVKKKKIIGIISEIILDEVNKHIKNSGTEKTLLITSAPAEKAVKRYRSVVIDDGDAHVLASAKEGSADYLVSLDKKHLLSLKEKIKEFKIVSPRELIKELQK